MTVPTVARHINAYHEDFGSVLWWTRPVCEPPYVGAPGHSDWPGYHRWWSPLPSLPITFTPTKRVGFSAPSTKKDKNGKVRGMDE